MTTTTTEQAFDNSVGVRITEQAHLLSLPVGTTFTVHPPLVISDRRYRIGGGEGGENCYLEAERNGRWVHTGGNLYTTRMDGYLVIESIPEGTPSNTSVTAVGDTFESRFALTSLPTGSVVRSRAGLDFTKQPDGTFSSNDGGADRHQETMTFSQYTLVSVGQGVQNRPAVGTRMTRDMAQAMTLGDRVQHVNGAVWEKQEDGSWVRERDGRRRYEYDFEWRRYDVYSLASSTPEVLTFSGEVPDPVGVEVPLAPETLRQFQQRFFTTAWGCAIYSGVTTNFHKQTMTDMGVDPLVYESVTPGMYLHPNDGDTFSRLPNGSIVQQGHESRPDLFRVMTVRNQDVHTTILGEGTNVERHQLWRVRHVPGGEVLDWVAEEWTPDQIEQVCAFRRRAQEFGERLRSDRAWCGQYQRDVAKAGIWAAQDGMPQMPVAADFLAADAVAALPQHTILVWEGHGEYVFVVRDDRMTNPSKTRHLAGTITGDWSPHNLRVVCGANAMLRIPVADPAMLRALNPDSEILHNSDRYVMNASRRWAYGGRDSGYESHDVTYVGTTKITKFANYRHPRQSRP